MSRHKMMKSLWLPPVILCVSCLTVKENGYVDTTFEDLVKRRGDPDYSIYQIIDKNYRHSDYEPDFSEFFDGRELEASVVVRYAAWKKNHRELQVWFKEINGIWVSFRSTEYQALVLR